MNCNHRNILQRRSGFTLIELLVVIAIIAILASLTLAGVMMFFRKGPEVQNKNDMLQISQALQRFKADYKRYPPSLIRLRANMKDYSANRLDALDDASIAFLNVMWPQLSGTTNIPWAGSVSLPASGLVLEGDQCLVFFLGGPPITGGTASAGLMGGFSTDPLNPVVASAGNRKKYIDFQTARLTIRANVAGQLFPSYVDAYGTQPFMYFGSTTVANRPNGYSQGANTLGIRPYSKDAPPATQFYNADSFQLISAGADMKWGLGGQWTPGSATGDGKDDVSNFSDKILGVP